MGNLKDQLEKVDIYLDSILETPGPMFEAARSVLSNGPCRTCENLKFMPSGSTFCGSPLR